MDLLRSAERRLAALEQGLLAVLLVVMVALSFLQVALRGLFSGGFLWADTFLRHLVLWAGFLGACLAAADGKQFAMDAAERLMPGRVKAAVHTVMHALTAAVCALMAAAAWTFLLQEKEGGATLFTVGSWHVPGWAFEVILPVGFCLLAVHYAVKSVLAADALAGGEAS
ncbi:TRAP transporter small permease [bacterium]|nr:MAG: TRAP transporter small permease [bacterium]